MTALWQFHLAHEGAQEYQVRHVLAENITDATAGAEMYRNQHDKLAKIVSVRRICDVDWQVCGREADARH